MKEKTRIDGVLKSIVLLFFVFAMFLWGGHSVYAADSGTHYLIPYFAENGEIYSGDSQKSFSMMGQSYYYGAAPNNLYQKRTIFFNLDNQFTSVTLDLGKIDGRDSYDGTASFYLDSELAEKIDVTKTMSTQKITLDTAGKTQLKIVISCPTGTSNYACYGVGNVIGIGGHQYESTITTPATLTSEGVRTYTCKDCGNSYTENIPSLSSCVPYLYPYDTSSGNVTVYKNTTDTFSVMGKNYSCGVAATYWNGDRYALYNLGQAYSSVTFTVGWVTAENYHEPATLKVYGDGTLLKTADLTYDMYNQTITVPTTGITQLKIEFGSSNSSYALFDMYYTRNSALTHSFTSEETLPASIGQSGIRTYTCQNCGVSYTEPIPALTASLSNAAVTLSKTSYTYTGAARKPSVTVTYNGKTLVKNTDYTITYKNNTNAGTATVTVTGKGSYTGSISKTFTINKASQTISAKISKSTITAKKTAAITASAKTSLSYKSSNTTIAKVSSKGVVTAKKGGKVTITVTAAASSNYKKATKKLTVTVKPSATAVSSLKSTKAGRMTVKWKKNSTGAGYQIQYSRSKTFKSGVVTVKISKASTTSKTITNLTRKKKYYVRIRTISSGATYKSSWSKVKSVTVK